MPHLYWEAISMTRVTNVIQIFIPRWRLMSTLARSTISFMLIQILSPTTLASLDKENENKIFAAVDKSISNK